MFADKDSAFTVSNEATLGPRLLHLELQPREEPRLLTTQTEEALVLLAILGELRALRAELAARTFWARLRRLASWIATFYQRF